MRIIHLSAEVSPFAKTGGLGDVVGALPIAQAELGHEVAVFMPLYRLVRDQAARHGWPLELALEPFQLDLGFEGHSVSVFRSTLPGSSVPLYLLRSDRFFDRPGLYDPDIHGRDDGLYRFAVFVRASLAAARRLSLAPEIVHAHDWHAALAPMALAWDRPADPYFARTATIFTIHNLAFQGSFERGWFPSFGLPRQMLPATLWGDRLNLLKGAVLAAGAVNTVSPSFAAEVTTPEGGFGLDAIFRFRGDNLVGIVNGIDRKVWNPQVDAHIPARYSPSDLSGKFEDRRTLLTMAGMDDGDPSLVVGMTGRLTEQKGYDLAFAAFDELVGRGVRFVLLGAGEGHLESAARALAARHRGRAWAHLGFDDALAHLIVAGCDAFLMPSRFEPCGLSQLYSLAYGSPPIVRRVGGLKDTVVPFDGQNLERATGFGFDAPTPEALKEAVLFARRSFTNRPLWSRLVANGMAQDFSWEHSARTYLELYRWQLAERPSRRATFSMPPPGALPPPP